MRLIRGVLILALLAWGAVAAASLVGHLTVTQDAARVIAGAGEGTVLRHLQAPAQAVDEAILRYREAVAGARAKLTEGLRRPVPEAVWIDLGATALALLIAMAVTRARAFTSRSWLYRRAYRKAYAGEEAGLKAVWETADKAAWGSFERFRLAYDGRAQGRAAHAARAHALARLPITRLGRGLAALLKAAIFLLPTLRWRGQRHALVRPVTFAARDMAWLAAFDLRTRRSPSTGLAQALIRLNIWIERLALHIVFLAMIAALFSAIWWADRIYAANYH